MINILYKFQLKSPQLQFLGSQGRVRLSFSFAGSRTPEKDDEWTFDPGFNVQVETQLANVAGTLSNLSTPATAEFQATSDAAQTAAPANSITLMPPDPGAAKAVCLNLTDDNMSVEIVSALKPPVPLPEELILVQTKLRENIRSAAGLKYYIAGLSNVYNSTPGSDLLKPKAFCFTCMPGSAEKKTPGSLCMWISVEGGADNGARSSGQTSVTFHPNDKDLQPIPKDSTASVIFSHRLMTNYITVCFLERSSIQDLTITGCHEREGRLRFVHCHLYSWSR